MICRKCGLDNDSEMSFCVSCGNDLKIQEETEWKEFADEKTKVRTQKVNRKLFAIASGLQIFIMLMFAISFLWENVNEKNG